MEESETAHEILAYLAEHPEASDTLEGIVEWWVLEQEIKYEIEMVRKAVAELVQQGILLEEKTGDSRTRYRTNQKKYHEIQVILRSSRR